VIAVDTSVIYAILGKEPDDAHLRGRLRAAGAAAISAGNVLELQLVVAGARGAHLWADVESLFRQYFIAVRPFDERQLAVAREAVLRFGKGRHKAGLNFGDCFAYALAKAEGLPLLFKGKDFAQTDVAVA
jgi:ribonuclease VapC